MKKNPFKYGSIVYPPQFFNRVKEIEKIKSILSSDNHLILISPRRYGKTSLVKHVLSEIKRPSIFVDLQLTTSTDDLAAHLLKKIYAAYPFQKVKALLKNFRILPTININPINNEVDVTFNTKKAELMPLEDVINLLDKLGNKTSRPIMFFDEFQDITRIGQRLDFHLRSLMQHHQNVNYIFAGSQETLMREIFEKKKSPFYHFGYLFPLGKIPEDEFISFIEKGFKPKTKDFTLIAKSIVGTTDLHPYYTQQLAFNTWEVINRDQDEKDPTNIAFIEIMQNHDLDYERMWASLNRTDMKVLIGMATSEISPLSAEFSEVYKPGPTSTVYSSIKKLVSSGYIIKEKQKYKIDNPFFKRWIVIRRNA